MLSTGPSRRDDWHSGHGTAGPKPSSSGSVLLAAVLLTAIITIATGSFLSYLNHEYRLDMRSHSWAESLQLAEGAVEVGLAELNYQYAGSNGFETARNWTNIAAGTYQKTITGLTNSTGEVLGDLTVTVSGLAGSNPQVLGVGTTTPLSGPTISRAVHVVTAPGSLGSSVVTVDTIKFSTANNYVDSFDSSTESKSTSHLYDVAKRQANGNTASKSTGSQSTQIGGGAVYGTASTAAGGEVVMTGSVGPTLDAAQRAYTVADGETKGYIRHDFTADIPDATVPPELTSAYSLGIINASQTISSGDYKVTSISMGNGETLTIDGTVRFYVTGKIATAGTGTIRINPLCSIKVYVGDSVDFKGSRGLQNDSLYASNAQFYGLSTCNTFAIATGTNWIGTVYAPQAAMTIGDTSLSGSVLADSVQLGSTGSIHYDEALSSGNGGGSGIFGGTAGGTKFYSVKSWQELKQVDGVWVTQ